MVILGLTGGIGAGKSVVGGMFKRRGFCLIDTDVIAREVVQPGSEGLAEIATVFGQEIINEKGELDRSKLARMVFSSEQQRGRLEGILHPRIRQIWQGRVEQERNQPYPGIVVDIPLLYETNVESSFDTIICVGCSWGVQLKRLRTRGWHDEDIGRRLQAQLPVSKKMDKADWIVWNDHTFEVCSEQVALIVCRLGTVGRK